MEETENVKWRVLMSLSICEAPRCGGLSRMVFDVAFPAHTHLPLVGYPVSIRKWPPLARQRNAIQMARDCTLAG